MPEPVTCHAPAPGSSIIQCDDVIIEPDPPEPQQVEPHEGSAGARALVRSYTPPLVHSVTTPKEPIEIPYLEIARRCTADTIAGVVVVGGATQAHPVLGALTALRTGIEIAQCIDDTVGKLQEEANEQGAIATCVANGGTPIGIVDGTVTCERNGTPEAR